MNTSFILAQFAAGEAGGYGSAGEQLSFSRDLSIYTLAVVLMLAFVIITYAMAKPPLRRAIRTVSLWTVGLGVVLPAIFWRSSNVDLSQPSYQTGRIEPRDEQSQSVLDAQTTASDGAASEEPTIPLEGDEKREDDPNLPTWVSNPPAHSASIHRRLIEAGPFATDLECRREIDRRLVEAAADYLETQVDYGNRQLLDVTPQFMREHVVVKEHLGTRFSPSNNQNMYTLYNLLEFDAWDHQTLTKMAREAATKSRLIYAGFGMGSLLVLLTSVFGYLRLDAATEGKYRRRLQAGVAGVLAAIAGGGWLLGQYLVLG